jgi:serine protease
VASPVSDNPGAVSVEVTTPGGTATKANAFTYTSTVPTITTVSPNTGGRDGGTVVKITGTNLADVSSVSFGGQTGTIVSQSATQITVTTPPEVAPYSPDLPTESAYANGTLWGLTGTFGVKVGPAWDKTQGQESVVVSVIDTGTTSHPDLGSKVSGYDMVSLDDVNNDGTGDAAYSANDGDGRDSDPSDPGDWISSSENAGSAASGIFRGCTVANSSWHGTHVAGTINAKINGLGTVGVAPGVRIQNIRALGKCGGEDSDIIAGILWAAGGTVSGVPTNSTPADVISMSLGGLGACSPGLQYAVDFAYERNIPVVVAAGNSNASAANYSPGNCTHVITVAATGSTGKRSSFSNSGSSVEISAPGESIYSTMNLGSTLPSGYTYVNYQGTSMATPHVAGVIALMLSREPNLTADEVLSRLQLSATGFSGGACDSVSSKTCGNGIVNAGSAVH